MPDEPHERPTTASIDRRVERLESSQAETDRKVDLLASKLGYLDDLIKLKFTTVEAAIGAQSAKLDSFMAKMDALVLESTRQSSDLEGTPIGRQVSSRLSKVEITTDEHQSELDKVEGAIWLVRGIATAGMALGGIATALQLVHLIKIP